MTAGEKHRVKVDIFGTDYYIVTDSSPQHTRKVAALVNNLIEKNELAHPRLDAGKLAVLAALHLADQMLLLESQVQALKDGEQDVTVSPAYVKLREDYAKLRTAYMELKQKYEK